MSDCRFGVSPVNYPDPDPDRKMFALCNLHCNIITAVLINYLSVNKGSYIHFYDIVLFNNVKIVIIVFSITASNNGCKLQHYYNRVILDILNSCGNIPNINIGV